MMAMFVQGFWFRFGWSEKARSELETLWLSFQRACLIAASNLQMSRCIPQFIILAKGKHAIAALLEVVADSKPSAPRVTHSSSQVFTQNSPTLIVKFGELALNNVFCLPFPTYRICSQNVSLFLPANETTFIVGSSDSDKSTFAQLLLGIYDPQDGVVKLDERDMRFLNEELE